MRPAHGDGGKMRVRRRQGDDLPEGEVNSRLAGEPRPWLLKSNADHVLMDNGRGCTTGQLSARLPFC